MERKSRLGRKAAPTTLAGVAAYKLTIRHGSRVERERFDDLDDAMAQLCARAEEVRAEGPLDSATAFKEYAPGARVAARLEISTGGMFSGRDAGVDVMGDGRVVPYSGGMRKRPLEADGRSPYDAVRKAMS